MLKSFNLMNGSKSFYGKAKVIVKDGYKYLKSYNTIVCAISPDGEIIRFWDNWSNTTGKHIDEFLYQNGYLEGINKKSWLALPVNREHHIPKEVKNTEMKCKVTYNGYYDF